MIRVGSSEDHGLALDVIQIDGGTQSRATLNDQVVNDYAEAIKAGATFPPIVVFYDGKKHWLADGFHRFHAYQKAGKSKVAADVRQGTRRDAILHSVGANETHGLRRTRDDKRRAVLTLLNDAEWGKWTDREIARRCAVSPQTVANVRADTVQNGQSDERTYVHPKTGKPTTMKTAGINASRAKPVVAENAPTEGTTPEPSLTKASEPEIAVEGTTSPTIPGVVLQMAWDRSSEQERADFMARNNLQFQAKASEDNGATGTDIEVPSDSMAGEVSRSSDWDERSATTSEDGRDSRERPAPNSPSAAPTAEPEATPSPPPASGTPLHSSELSSSPALTDSPAQSSSLASGANPSPAYLAGDDGHRGTPSSDALAAGQGESPDSIAKSGQAVTNPKPFVLRPHCLNPDSCAGYSTKHCHACLKARDAAILADGAAA